MRTREDSSMRSGWKNKRDKSLKPSLRTLPEHPNNPNPKLQATTIIHHRRRSLSSLSPRDWLCSILRVTSNSLPHWAISTNSSSNSSSKTTLWGSPSRAWIICNPQDYSTFSRISSHLLPCLRCHNRCLSLAHLSSFLLRSRIWVIPINTRQREESIYSMTSWPGYRDSSDQWG